MTVWIRDMLIIFTILIVGLVLFGKLPIYWNYDGTTHILYVQRESPPEVNKIFYELNPDKKKKHEEEKK